MRVSYFSLLCGAIAVAASNEHFTNSWNEIAAGQPFDLAWDGNIGAVNITLNQGPKENYTVVDTIASKTPTTNEEQLKNNADQTQPTSLQTPSPGT